MAIVLCDKGHYYDDVMNTKCPVCMRSCNFDDVSRMQKVLEGEEMNRLAMEYVRKSAGTNSSMEVHPQIAESEILLKDQNKNNLEKQIIDEKQQDAERNRKFQDDDEKTVGIYSYGKEKSYVTGWIVCVEGRLQGKHFALFSGFNRIGKGLQNDISLLGGKGQIAEQDHFSIVYEERGNRFYLIPQNGTVEVEGMNIGKTIQLHTSEDLVIGEERFVFIAFCEDGRSWQTWRYK